MTIPQPPQSSFNLRDLATLFFKHRGKILWVFCGTVLTVAIGSFVLPPIYQAEATLMIKMGREHIYRPEIGGLNPSIAFDQKGILESEVQILTSRDLAARVITDIGIHALYPDFLADSSDHMPPLERSILELQDHLHITEVKDSGVLKVSFEHERPEMASQVVNRLVDFLLQKHLEIFSNPQVNFLETQAETYHQKFLASQSQLQAFKHRHGLSSLKEEQRLLLEQRQELDAGLKNIYQLRQGLASKLSSLKAQIDTIPPTVPLASVSEQQRVIDEANANLLELKMKEQNLLTQYKDTSRLIKNIRSEINMVKQFIQEQEARLTDKVTTGTNPVYQELAIERHKTESELRSLATQAETMEKHLKQLDQKLASLDRLEKELDTLQLKAESDEENYKMYLAKVEEARVSEEMDRLKMANISVIQPATIPSKPVKPQKTLNLALSVVLGGLFAFLLAFFSEFIQGGFTRPEQASRELGLPILVSVGYKE